MTNILKNIDSLTKPGKHYRQRRALGLCGYCGKVPSIKIYCDRCFKMHSKVAKIWRSKPKVKEKIINLSKERHKQRKNDVLLKYGGRCSCCGEDYFSYLEIDHINGGGTKEIRELGGGRYLSMLYESPIRDDLQILCANCHTAKTKMIPCYHKISHAS